MTCNITRYNYLIIVLLLLLTSINIFGQNKKEIFDDAKFGIHLSPIIPNQLVNRDNISLLKDSFEYKFKQKPGINFGMEIRLGFKERFSFHAGLNLNRRNFSILYKVSDSIFVDSVLQFTSYELPLFAGYYVKLSSQFYLNTYLGFCLDMYPTNISIPHVFGKRYNWAQFSLAGGPGIEWRTKNSGYFYIGMNYKVHFKNMLYVLFYYDEVIGEADENIAFSGNFFSICVKYYLP
ncbi:MAG: outer membrane beta-barrel protein [Bacteroidota bacterium]